MTGDLSEAGVGSTLWALAWPTAVGVFFVYSIELADTWFVSRLGVQALAAIAFAFPLVLLCTGVLVGLGNGVAAVLALARGRDGAPAATLAAHALALAVVLGGAMTGLGLAGHARLTAEMGADAALAALAGPYLVIWLAGLGPLAMLMAAGGVLRADGDTRTPALLMGAASLINLALDPLLIFGAGPIPGLGLRGAALATVLSRTCLAGIILAVLVRRQLVRLSAERRPRLHEPLGSCFRRLFPFGQSWRILGRVVGPTMATKLVASASVAAMTTILSSFGAASVAAYGLASRVETLMLVPIAAISSALTPFVGVNWGSDHRYRVLAGWRWATRVSAAWGALTWTLLLAAAVPIARHFVDAPELVALTADYLYIVPLSWGLYGMVSATGAAFQAMSRAPHALALAAGRGLLLGVPLAWLGGRGLGPRGVFVGIAAATTLTGLLAWIAFRRACAGRGSLATP